MIALYIIGAIIALIVLIALIPIKVRIAYFDDIAIYLPVLFFNIKLYPREKKLKQLSEKKLEKQRKKEEKKQAKKEAKKKDHKKNESKAEKKKLNASDVKALAEAGLSLVGDVLSKIKAYLKVKIYDLRITVASDDAAKTALIYGSVSATFAVIFERLEENCKIRYARKSDVGIDCDFLSERCVFKFNLLFSIRVWQAVATAVGSLLKLNTIKSITTNKPSKKTEEKKDV